ncbi:helix-turn-helix domain-containing protein [Vibrio azureus]|nr:helix-turn-helix domain-containing protein [Vibrio azureus]
MPDKKTMLEKQPILDRKTVKQLIRTELEPTWSDSRANPDMSWVIPLVTNELFEAVLIHCRGNQAKASRTLGINRGTYRTKLKNSHRKEFGKA